MAASNPSSSPLQKEITEKLAQYIDRAITAPPKHQPFVSYNEYDIFVLNMEAHTAGIDMKQPYVAKPTDASWVNEHDAYSINLARLFLAVGERDTYPTLPGTSPALSLDSVDLRLIPHARFEAVLFRIANATERTVHAQPPKDPAGCARVFAESRKKTFGVDMEQPYARRADDPHWLVRYSDMAVNVVRLSLAVRANLGDSAPQNADAAPAQPLPPMRIRLDSVSLKDITHREFFEHLTGFFDAQTRERERVAAFNDTADALAAAAAANAAGQANPVGLQNTGVFDPEDAGDDGEGGETGYEGDDDAMDGTDEDSDLPGAVLATSLDDASDSDSDSEASSSSSSDDDSDDDHDLSYFESEADRDSVFADWSENEDAESLPIDIIEPLLDDPTTHDIAVDMLIALLGVAKAPKEELMKEVRSVLHEQRKAYRIAHTRPFMLNQTPRCRRTLTPFLEAYEFLMKAVYMMRRIPAGLSHPEAIVPTLDAVKALLEGSKGMHPDTVPDSRAVIAERMRVARIRIRMCMSMYQHVHDIEVAHFESFTSRGSARNPIFVVNPDKVPALLAALQSFKQFDEKYIGRKYFKEFPGCLVKPFRVITFLKRIYELKKISEFKKYPDIVKASDIAQELQNKWHERSLDAKNSLFVPLRY